MISTLWQREVRSLRHFGWRLQHARFLVLRMGIRSFLAVWSLETRFVGYKLDYPGLAVGISDARGEWPVNFLKDLRRDKYTVHVHRFAEFLGRLGFTCRVLLWLKPRLAPLYAWASAVSKSTVATAPKLAKLVCMFLEKQFEVQLYMFSYKGLGL